MRGRSLLSIDVLLRDIEADSMTVIGFSQNPSVRALERQE